MSEEKPLFVDFIRHAVSEDGMAGVVQRDDSPLHASHALQVYAPYFQRYAGGFVYTSPITRAYQTGCGLGLLTELYKDLRLREIEMGAAIGEPATSLSDGLMPAGGETRVQVRLRVEKFFEDLQGRHKCTDRILVITHKAVIRAALSYATDGVLARAPVDHLHVTRFRMAANSFGPVFVNIRPQDVDHMARTFQ